MASTAPLMAEKAWVTPGTLSITTAVANVTARPIAACRKDTARRFSLMSQAKARRATMPKADWSCCCMPLDPRLALRDCIADAELLHRHGRLYAGHPRL